MPPLDDAAIEDKQVGTSAAGALSSREESLPAPPAAKNERGFLEEVLNRKPLNFDSQFHGDVQPVKAAGALANDDDRHHRWEHLQADWNSNWESTSVDSDSRGADLSGGKGKGKAKATPFSAAKAPIETSISRKKPKAIAPRRSADRPLQWTMQRSPFHSSQIGKLAARRPHSIGLFKPDYPFTPSGRKKKPPGSTSEEPNLLPTTFKYDYSLDPKIVNSNVMKHGWTAAILDDDVKLSVPDESRRSRQTSLYARELLGKKWYRWRPGEGWVYCRTKDLSAYRRGPGIALGQLLPPRDKAVTSQLPLIPNDSKRDFVLLLISCMLFFAGIALLREYRQRCRTNRKGKRRNRSSENGGHSLIRPRSSSSAEHHPKARQRTRAQQLRDLCHFALSKSVIGVGQAASSTTNGLASMGWTSNSKGISSGLVNGTATRRTPTHSYEHDVDGVSIELLEKGGVDGSSIVSPVKEDARFDLLQVSSASPGCSAERCR